MHQNNTGPLFAFWRNRDRAQGRDIVLLYLLGVLWRTPARLYARVLLEVTYSFCSWGGLLEETEGEVRKILVANPLADFVNLVVAAMQQHPQETGPELFEAPLVCVVFWGSAPFLSGGIERETKRTTTIVGLPQCLPSLSFMLSLMLDGISYIYIYIYIYVHSIDIFSV